MRNIQTFIAHLLWDEKEPDVLRGSLRNVTSNQVHTFGNQGELVTLLQEMMHRPVDEPTASLDNTGSING